MTPPPDDRPPVSITTGTITVDLRDTAATHHLDTRYLNRAERRRAGYVRGRVPVGGVVVRREID